MRITLVVTAALALAVFAGHARGGQESAVPPASAEAAIEALEWPAYVRVLSGRAPARSTASAAEGDPAASPDLDVVDAHWMALTMWGEARGQGEEAMRAVGHVIDNRRRASGADLDFVTDTVSEAFQFSCWNPGDPNRDAMLNVDALPPDSRDHLMWAAARDLADEILAGRSLDPTDGALFYHAAGVAPAWARGVAPVARIGDHLFYRAARRP